MTKQRMAMAELRPGMIVAEDLEGNHGQRLLAAGVTLTERLIDILRESGIEAVALEGPQEPRQTQEREAACLALRAEVERRFRHARGLPAMEAIRSALLRHRLRAGGCDA